MYIIGVSAFYHDSAACLMKNGEIVFAAHEERFTRTKHDNRFPINAIKKALEYEGITMEEVSLISYYEKPFLKLERIIDTYASKSPVGFWSFKKAIKSLLSKKLWVSDIIKKETGYKGEIVFTEHHEAHAASAFFASPFKEAVVITMDGVGEKQTASISIGNDSDLQTIEEQNFPHSLGLFYSAITYYCGFKVNSGEYKLMGLAPYGEPKYVNVLRDNFITVNDDGSVHLNLKHFNFEVGFKMVKKSFGKILGNGVRQPESEMTQFYKDIAASAQKITEEAVIKTVEYAKKITGQTNVCLAGGVALNCKANGELLKLENIEKFWVQPASGDSGGAVGSAYIAWHKYLNKERKIQVDSPVNHAYLGTRFTSQKIKDVLDEFQLTYHEFSEDHMLEEVVEKLAKKQIVGWFNGRMEYGPRALGNRSILGSPLFADMKRHINLKIKKREGFRPFAPMVKEESVGEWFAISEPSKYMLFTCESDKKDKIPSCIHEDDTARVQTVSKQDNPLTHKLLDAFEKQTGTPVLINTSFNVRGEPIVESPMDALNCFFQTDMDVLVLEGIIVTKSENKNHEQKFKNKHAFQLD